MHPVGERHAAPGVAPVSYTHLSRVGEDTTLSQIIRMVSDAAATKAPIAKVADRVSGVFVPAVISIAPVSYTHLDVYKRQGYSRDTVRRL